mgnify:CR=1 FL=1|jgi:hypothetical protein
MPGAAPSRAQRDTAQGGGTAVDEPPSRLARGALVVAGVAVVAAVIALIATRGSARRRAEPAQVTAAVPQVASARVDEVPVTPTEAPPPPPDPWPVLDRLEGALAAERLYGKASMRGDRVEVRSSFCDDARAQAIIDGARSALRGVGATSLACVAPHGGVVFVRTL